MSDLFAPRCPECGTDLPIEQRWASMCGGCGVSYVNWFGNVIPDPTIDTAELPAA